MPIEWLDKPLAGNPLGDWLLAAGTAVAASLLLALVLRLVARRLRKLAIRTETRLDDLLADLLKRTRWYFFLAVALWAGSRWLALPEGAQLGLRRAILAAAILQAGAWLSILADFWIGRYREEQQDPATRSTAGAFGFMARVGIYALVGLLILDNIGVDITALVTGLGIGGIAIGLAVQKILGDLFASLSIVLDKPFVLDDFIVVGDLSGTVEHIGIKSTRIRSLSGEQIVFSNSDLLESRIRNYKRMTERRVLFGLGVVYDTPAETLEKIPGWVREIVEAQPRTRFDRAHFKKFGDSSLDYEVVYFVLSPEYLVAMDIQQAINLALVRRFAEAGVGFAFPTRTLHLETVPAGLRRDS